MSDMGAKNGEGILEVLADDMGRYGLLTAFGLGPIQLTGPIRNNLINNIIIYSTLTRFAKFPV